MPAVGELRQPTGTAFTIRDPLPWPDVAAIAREGEALGYAAVFLPETGARDTLATLTGLAGETSTLLLGTGVIPMAARTPKLAAMAAATVQERSGVGTSSAWGPAGRRRGRSTGSGPTWRRSAAWSAGVPPAPPSGSRSRLPSRSGSRRSVRRRPVSPARSPTA